MERKSRGKTIKAKLRLTKFTFPAPLYVSDDTISYLRAYLLSRYKMRMLLR